MSRAAFDYALAHVRIAFPDLCQGVEFVLVPEDLWPVPGTVGLHGRHDLKTVAVLERPGCNAAEYVATLRHELEHVAQARRGVPPNELEAEFAGLLAALLYAGRLA